MADETASICATITGEIQPVAAADIDFPASHSYFQPHNYPRSPTSAFVGYYLLRRNYFNVNNIVRPITRMKQLLSTIVGAIMGIIVALAITYALTMLAIKLSPGDKSAGSVSIIAIGLVPIGLIVGAIVGL